MAGSNAARITRLLAELYPELQPGEQQQLGRELDTLIGRATQGKWDLTAAKLQTKGARQQAFGTTLQKLREAAGLTQGGVSDEAHWHSSKLSRIESGRLGINYVDLQYLLRRYRALAQVDSLWQLAVNSGKAIQPRGSARKAS